jgi:hypothetical protein
MAFGNLSEKIVAQHHREETDFFQRHSMIRRRVILLI